MKTYTATPRDIEQRWFIVDADGMILGLRSKAYIRAGDWAVLVGKRVEVD